MAAAMNYLAAAEYLGLLPSQFLALVRAGKIAGRVPDDTKLKGRGRVPKTILFLKKDLDAYLESLDVLAV